MSLTPNPKHWDIFCAVVDNYGDIGVTWRLAKQLAHEYQLDITLWVDDLHSFSHILPTLTPQAATQVFNNVTIKQWNQPLDLPYVAGDVLIEAFACELPESVKAQLLALKQTHLANPLSPPPPLWLNLEYLSAESWVEGCHALPSMQASGLKKYFYFPGFTDKTGGLICEHHLFNERERWQADSHNKMALFSELGLSGIHADDFIISVFSYENQALPALCELWQDGANKVHLLIPKGRSLNSLSAWLDTAIDDLVPGEHIERGQLSVHILPMTDQQGYDRLLWSCDFNIVRGEDSFLRAQWAAKPFIWHIYPQEDDYHLVKLEAFMQLYCDNLPPEIAGSWRDLTLSFNQEQQSAVTYHWQQLNQANLPLLQHAKQWPIDAINTADLASRLVNFVESR
ncbi:elongation factor P maturation arginine rhamnosyltransferase EarP [Shewanella sp. SNU WT4]|uniref:elongation factor P maturation arginine rhamnosyltransferase EarP n=1 Tax=Shewanella sp. SNU WT4 TaxID=2590015 RepID=UPI00112E7BC3|nr:elongation factor P maturation arginine rhamnosyltransferase EarP [Shewanella sp. SNU WT4]QDF67177.1 elongation factor P maturation arginine rhamnosyltransferase EarP [Shewanella sp. SNU WT4]